MAKKSNGIMDIATEGNRYHTFENYKKGKKVTVPKSFQARSHSTPVKLAYITDAEAKLLKKHKPGVPHEGPMGIPNYNDYDPSGGGYGTATAGSQMSGFETGNPNESSRADARSLGYSPKDVADIRGGALRAGAGQTVNPGLFGSRNRPGVNVNRGFNLGTLGRGIMSIFGGIPGMIGSALSAGWGKFSGKDLANATDKSITEDPDYAKDIDTGYARTHLADLASKMAPVETVAPVGYDQSMDRDFTEAHAKDGGRIGYRNAGPVLDEAVQEDLGVQDFMIDQGIPSDQMAEGEMDGAIFNMRVKELMKMGLDYDDAYDIAAQEFQDLFAEQSDQDQGIASII